MIQFTIAFLLQKLFKKVLIFVLISGNFRAFLSAFPPFSCAYYPGFIYNFGNTLQIRYLLMVFKSAFK
jgi:hypothetical protein